MFSEFFSLQGLAAQLILFLYDHVSTVISGSASRPRRILTSVVIRDASAWETGVAPLKPHPPYLFRRQNGRLKPKQKSRAVPRVTTAEEMAALGSPLARFSSTDRCHFFRAGSMAVSQLSDFSNVGLRRNDFMSVLPARLPSPPSS
ncbi:hypothetical protein IscW_ISCW011419 [Ixodes scapularis]|uniref:Secreted protein n=1 Tax=Ixodes scapularis TaxID=6945 RepID=B7Q659_IXOSC|nr:hypothetical protein IscW_ISCW011419 [Ixodes scapularis]|eukprot:XP_002411897.1 hypothetical protein IscW_ISCW011419 [Ixodes scapularis]